MYSRILLVTVLMVFMVFLAGCSGYSALVTETESVKMIDTDLVKVEIKKGKGELVILGGSENLLDATFVYNVARWKPIIELTRDPQESLLTVRQPSSFGFTFKKTVYDWSLKYNNNVPLDLRITMGAGDCEAQLGSLYLKNLDLTIGTGSADVNLVGDWRSDLYAEITGGVGSATVILPKDVGVRVEATGGIGSVRATGLKQDGHVYTNDAFGKTDVTLHIEVEGGLGTITLKLAE